MSGKPISTSLEQADDDPQFDGHGYTALQTPEGSDTSVETEDDPAFQALADEMSPGEAQETVDFMRPLTDEESEILENNPGLQDLTKVDDSEHQDWLINHAREGTKAMDNILDDASYGEISGLDDLGWGLSSIKKGIRKAGRGIGKAGRGVGRAAKGGAKGVYGSVKKLGALMVMPALIPIKAVIRRGSKKLVTRRANQLAKERGLGKPGPTERKEALTWAKNEVRKSHRLGPVIASLMGNDSVVETGSFIGGNDVMGMSTGALLALAALGPISVAAILLGVVNKAISSGSAPRPAEGTPEENAEKLTPDEEAAAQAEPIPQPDSAEPAEASDQAEGWKNMNKGDDSLGAFAAQILGRAVPARKKAPNIAAIVIHKLKHGKKLTVEDRRMLGLCAQAGNVKAQKLSRLLASRNDVSGIDPWMYKLNPSYWFSSSRKRGLIDIEKKKSKETDAMQEQLKKQQEDLEAAQRAASAAAALEAAKAQSLATEKQLKEIAESLKGDVSGDFIGHEKQTPVATVVLNALKKVGKEDVANRLYGKIKDGQPLTKDELKEARSIARSIAKIKVVHGDFVGANEILGTFIGGCVLGQMNFARVINRKHAKLALALEAKAKSGKPLTKEERQVLARLLMAQRNLRRVAKSAVNGSSFIGCDKRASLMKGAFVGAIKAMSESDKKSLLALKKLAAEGNPRAKKAIAALRKSGEIMGGDFIGLSISSALKYATAPVWAPAYGVYKGAQWAGKKMGIGKSGSSPEQVRLSKLRAAAKRRRAAEARARAADAQSEAEQRAQQAIADAADAEADAEDAQATAKEMSMRTAEIEADPSLAASADDSSEGEFIGADKKAAHPVTTKAATSLVKNARLGSKPHQKAIKVIIAKAKKGDAQAKRDLTAVRTAAKADRSQKLAVKAQKKAARKAVRVARAKKVVAARAKIEAGIAGRLARMERKRKLSQLAKVERLAAKGHPKAKAYVKQQVVAAKKGNKKAQIRVRAMQLSKQVRVACKSPQERRRIIAAQKFVARLNKGDKKAWRQYEAMMAAEKSGNPNAKRFMARVRLGGAIVSTLATGVIALPKKSGAKAAGPGTAQYKKNARTVADLKAQLKSGKPATREELTEGARAAQEMGDAASAAALMEAASKAPSATEELKKHGAAVAAAELGNKKAKEEIAADLAAAKAGDEGAIKRTANTLAVNTIADVEKGKPMSPVMREAVQLQQRAEAGDPTALATAQNVKEAASVANPKPEAVLAATTLAAASVVDRALSSKPQAREEWLAAAQQPMTAEEKKSAEAQVQDALRRANEGTLTAEEGEAAAMLAARMGKPKLAAEIAAKAPPLDKPYGVTLSSLPDSPLAPITGPLSLMVESVKALTFTTRDPLANYRSGIASRSSGAPAETASTSMGWSPFSFFKVVKQVAPYTGFAASTATLATLASQHMGKKNDSKPSPVAAPVAAPMAQKTDETAEPKTETKSDKGVVQVGSERGFKELIADALKNKSMSKKDFEQAVALNAGDKVKEPKMKLVLGEQIHKFLTGKGVKIG